MRRANCIGVNRASPDMESSFSSSLLDDNQLSSPRLGLVAHLSLAAESPLVPLVPLVPPSFLPFRVPPSRLSVSWSWSSTTTVARFPSLTALYFFCPLPFASPSLLHSTSSPQPHFCIQLHPSTLLPFQPTNLASSTFFFILNSLSS